MKSRSGHRRVHLIATIVLSTVLSQLILPQPAHADALVSSGVSDRAKVVGAWQTGGDLVRAAAAKALLGTDTDVQHFLSTEWAERNALDKRISVVRMLSTGGTAVQTAAQQALDSPDSNGLQTFLESGWQDPATTDERVRIVQMMATGGTQLDAAAQKALDDGTADALKAFLGSGWQQPYNTDQRIKVLGILASGGKEVRTAAQRALDASDTDALNQFINSGWAVAAARDQETATITDLVNAASDAGAKAAAATKTAKDEAAKAAVAAAAAKAAAQRAAAAVDAAKDDAAAAAAAAQQAAEAAKNAASAAKVAISAAAAAGASARVASSAAARAASAAAAVSRAAVKAQQAAGLAATDAKWAGQSRDAAKKARDIAKAAKSVADAAAQAGTGAIDAQAAAISAAFAGQDAKTAADQALAALRGAKQTGRDAQQAIAAAQRAQAQAARSTQAANAAAAYAAAAGAAAFKARDAANRAIADANVAADAADDAALHAGEAAQAAKRATAAAVAATTAANAAVTAANSAQDVYTAARANDAAQLAAATAEGEEDAKAQSDAWQQQQLRAGWIEQEAAKRTAETNQLIAAVNNPATPPADAITDARKVAMVLVGSDGSWTNSAAIDALSGTDQDALDFVRTGIGLAAAQDDRVTIQALAATGSAALAKAVDTALGGSDADVSHFLANPTYPDRVTENRVTVVKLRAAAQADNDVVAQQKSQAALDDGSDAALNAYVMTGQYSAAADDDRVKAVKILNDSTSGPETKARAQIALDSPPSALHKFVTSGQYVAQQNDLDTATHDAEVAALVVQAQSIAQTAVQNSQEAQAVAATANGLADQAKSWSDKAKASAQQASNLAGQAVQSANQADQSAARAAASAQTAQKAAASARASAQDAAHSAAWAQHSYELARSSASKALKAAEAAKKSWLDAGKSAAEALRYYNETYTEFVKKDAEQQKYDAGVAYSVCADESYPLPPSKDCLNQFDTTDRQRLEQGLANSEFCGRVYQQGSEHFNACLQHAFSPNFGTFEALNFGDALIGTITVFAEFNLGLMGGIACGQLCSGLFMMASPEMLFGAGMWDLLATFGLDEALGSALGDIGVTRLEGLFEDIGVESEASFAIADDMPQDLAKLLSGNCATAVVACGVCPPGLPNCNEILEEIYLAQMGGTVSKDVNVAGVQLRLGDDAESTLYISFSGGKPRTGMDINLIPTVGSKDNPMLLISTRLPGENNPREFDTEYKLLNFIANHLKNHKDETGILFLYTERKACNSCAGVIKQFKGLYPNIDVYVVAGTGPVRR